MDLLVEQKAAELDKIENFEVKEKMGGFDNIDQDEEEIEFS